MAEASVSLESLSAILWDYLREFFVLKSEVDEKIKKIDPVVRELKDNLDRGTKRRASEVIDRKRHIGDIIYEFQNVKDKFNEVVASRSYNRAMPRSDLREIYRDLEGIDDQIDLLKTYGPPEAKVSKSNSENGSSSKFPPDFDFVGRTEEMDELRSLLCDEDPQSPVVAICGTCGSGKTALAVKLFHDMKKRNEFDFCVWVNMSDTYETIEILLFIYGELPHLVTQEITEEANLVRQIYQIQEMKKCLIVLDGLWSSDAWQRLRQAFPSGKTRSKILITTQMVEAAENMGAKIHKLRCLSEDEGLQLFLKTARRFDRIQDLESEEVCSRVADIVKRCEGLPLSVVESVQSAINHPYATWNHEFYADIIHKIAERESVLMKLTLSFENLPHFLSRCFLYLGLMEDDSQIEAERLYLLWLGDGLLLPQFCEGEEILMNVAEQYLNRLAGRSLIEVQEAQVATISKLYSCKLNPLMRELCREKSKEHGFFKGLDFEDCSYKGRRVYKKIYQVSINLDNWKDGQMVLERKHIYCLLFWRNTDKEKNEGFVWPKKLYVFRFVNLKILTFTGFNFLVMKLPAGIQMLVRLRYLSFKGCCLSRLPSSVLKLGLLEILDLRVENEMVIPNVLRMLKKLKHLYFPLKFKTERAHELLRLDGLKNLETITNMNTKQVNVEDLFELPNLCYIDVVIPSSLEQIQCVAERMATTIGAHSLHASVKISDDFDCYTDERRSVLINLLGCPSLIVLDITGYIYRLPWSQGIDSNLAKVVLVDSELVEDSMESLKKLKRLRVLVLRLRAYMGHKIICSSSDFKELRRLELLCLKNLEMLTVTETAMPNLANLVIEDCEKLIMQPNELGFVGRLQEVKVSGIHNEFKESLEKVRGNIVFA